MNTDLNPYPAYKHTGVPWLGAIPAHWAKAPGRACYREKKVPNTSMKETTVLSLSHGQIVVKPPEKLHGLVPASFETYQIVDPGDIIVRPTDLQNDWNSLRFGLSRHRGIITSAYMCFHTEDVLTREYGHLLLHTYDLKKVFYGLGSGLRQNLDWRDFKYLPCLVPPPDEQLAIVRYLDYMDLRIRHYIRVKQKLIALLNEQKQAIIHQAVTRGLDPNVRLKPSGVEWLEEVPEHWELHKLGQVARVFNGTTPSRMQPSYWNGGTIPWLSSGKVNDYIVKTPAELVTERALRECSISLVPKGSVIIGLIGQGKTRGMSALLAIDACINQNLAAIVPGQVLMGNFLLHVLTAHYRAIREIGRGGNQEALNCSIIAGLRIPVPPIEEQAAIIKQVAEATLGIDGARDRAQRGIALLREYRTRLIADVVTGKVDVRAVARALLDEIEEVELVDEVDDGEERLGDDEDIIVSNFDTEFQEANV